jgi:electron transport complex protein RnfG
VTDKVQPQDPSAAQAQEAPAAKEVSTFRLMATLTVAGALAGLLIVLVNQHTKYRTYYLVGDTLSLALPEGAKEAEFKRVYIGYDTDSQLKGVAVSRGESGFQDVVQVIFGFDPASGKLLGMKVLESKETPGLGDKIFKDQTFVDQFFAAPDTPLVPVKAGAGKGLPGEIDTITGATISSKVVIDIINHGLEEWLPVLQKGIPQAPGSSGSSELDQANPGNEEAMQ